MSSVPIQLRHEACLIKNKLQTNLRWSRKLAAFNAVVQGKADMRAFVDSQDSSFQSVYGIWKIRAPRLWWKSTLDLRSTIR